MAALPVAHGLGTYIQGHAQGLAGVESGAPHLYLVPARPQIPRPHLGVGLEAARGQNHRPSPGIFSPLGRPDPDSCNLVRAILEEAGHPGLVGDVYPRPLCGCKEVFHQPYPLVSGLKDAARVETELVVAPHRPQLRPLPYHPQLRHPQHRRVGLLGQELGQFSVGLALSHPHQVVEEPVGGVVAHLHPLPLSGGKALAKGLQVRDALVGEAKQAAAEPAISSPLSFWGLL